MCFLGRDEWEDVEDAVGVEGVATSPASEALFLEIDGQTDVSDVVCVNGHFQVNVGVMGSCASTWSWCRRATARSCSSS